MLLKNGIRQMQVTVLSFLTLGTFHLLSTEVTGMACSLSPSEDGSSGDTWNFFDVIFTGECNSADTCVQLADFLLKIIKQLTSVS